MDTKELMAQALKRYERLNTFLAEIAPDVVVVAEYGPGFSSDLSSWCLTLSASGVLTQHTEILNFDDHSNDGPRRDVVEVGAQYVAFILKRADELDFWNLDATDPDCGGNDLPSVQLTIKNGNRQRTYNPESVGFYAYRGNEGAKRFLELWNLIHQHAPFPLR